MTRIAPKESVEPGKEAPDWTQKNPHGSFEIGTIRRGHNLSESSGKALVRVPSQRVFCLAVAQGRPNATRFLNSLCFFVFVYAESESFATAGTGLFSAEIPVTGVLRELAGQLVRQRHCGDASVSIQRNKILRINANKRAVVLPICNISTSFYGRLFIQPYK